MGAIQKTNEPTDGSESGQLLNHLPPNLIGFVLCGLTKAVHGYKQRKAVVSFNSLRSERGKLQLHSLVPLEMD